MTNLTFTNFQHFRQEDLSDLDKVYQDQLLIVAQNFWGQDYPLEKVLCETYNGDIEFWQVKDDEDNMLYDVWIANADTGAVFQTQTTIDTGVGMIQNYFGPLYEDKGELGVLAAQLQEAFRDRPDVYDDTDNSPEAAYRKAVRAIEEAEKKKKKDE